ncbi:mannose-6-phosphate isomerase, class I [Pseudalkalibacillus hwajinpoensis]|uniref:mannose-6-phosphate isomerase, class I n=1 Tax=Guptibacillus hwajinpoensis TaxID=208199 RepID=UPI001CFE285C|nr:mannose-6-phosphate isomerase, class I [Pseudalkalibacillus hwajinpoensis]
MYERQPIFLKPNFKDRIWGGTNLREKFDYDIPTETTGECWGISAHSNGPSEILNGPLNGKTLDIIWKENQDLFRNEGGEHFPLLIKILDANNDLSVQVHPDDSYAREVENEAYGKTECWYILDCEEDSEIIFGHHAQSREEFQQLIEEGKWDSLLRSIKIKPGEFYYVPSGTIHAIGKGTMILETQQSSDTTYRVYDYDRTDSNGNKRDLHIAQSIEVSTVPHEDPELHPKREVKEGLVQTELVKEQYFTVWKWEVNGHVQQATNGDYLLVSVLSGEGSIGVKDEDALSIMKGDHFIIPSTMKEFVVEGKLEMMVSKSNG